MFAKLRGRSNESQRQSGDDESGSDASILEQYVSGSPTAQNAVDVFAGEWSSRFPDSVGVSAGEAQLFEDPWMKWAIEQAGPLDGRRVLELGPLEGAHSSMLDAAGAEVFAIEANTHAYLKCLITKELMGLSRCRFQLGDFVPFMQETDERFDFVVSSGVLYHQTDPLGFLEAVARVGRRVAIWTHYFDPSIVAADPAQARFFLPEPEIVEWSELQISLHRRNYLESLGWGGFCGGPATSVLWMERDDLFAVLHRLGYDRIEVMHDDRTHPFGARIMLFAEQT